MFFENILSFIKNVLDRDKNIVESVNSARKIIDIVGRSVSNIKEVNNYVFNFDLNIDDIVERLRFFNLETNQFLKIEAKFQ